MSYELTGKVYRIFDTDQIKETFRKREFVVEQQSGQYPNYIKFQLVQDRCSLVDNYNEGDEITVSFDLKGREWNGKFFTNVEAWRVQGAASGGSQAPPPASEDPFPKDEPAGFSNGAKEDDLPF